jgi:hypothetical protein
VGPLRGRNQQVKRLNKPLERKKLTLLHIPQPGATPEASAQNPYAMHFQSVWRERALAYPDWDAWLRVAAMAYGCHRRNGHANFKKGELMRLLGISRSTNLSRAIREAKQYGMIAGESNSRCLVVPPHAVIGGKGDANERCPHHEQDLIGNRFDLGENTIATRSPFGETRSPHDNEMIATRSRF